MNSHHLFRRIIVVASIYVFACSTALTQSVLPEAMQLDLKRVEETWRILDRYAEAAWPGWKNYTEIPFRLNYPDGVSLQIVEPRFPEKFKLVEGVTLRGKKIYVDDSRMNSIILSPRLEFAGGGAGLGTGHPSLQVHRAVITKEREHLADSLVRSLGNPTWPSAIAYSTDQTIVGFVHELFHCYTDFGPMWWGGKLFDPDLNYAVYSEMEGALLERAAFERDTALVRQYVVRALVARERKLQNMSSEHKTFAADQEKAEGTAEYAAYRVVELLKKGYEPGLSPQEDPLYFGFRYSEYFAAARLRDFEGMLKNTLVAGGKNYAIGFFSCLVLDKLRPEWKNGFFENKRSFEELLRSAVVLKEEQKASMLDEVKKECGYDALVQRHSPVFARRDSVIKLFQNPTAKTYVINFKALGLRPTFTSIEQMYPQDMQYYYAPGLTTMQIGDARFESKGTAVCYDIRTTSITVVDFSSQSDAKGYEVKSNRQDAEGNFWDADVTAYGFSLHAGKVKIVESPTKVEFVLLPSAK